MLTVQDPNAGWILTIFDIRVINVALRSGLVRAACLPCGSNFDVFHSRMTLMMVKMKNPTSLGPKECSEIRFLSP